MGILKFKIRSWCFTLLLLITALLILMHIIINALCNYYTSNKFLLEECNKEENVGVIGAAATSSLQKAIFKRYRFFTIYRIWTDKINTKIGTAVNAACQGNRSAYHRFVSPALGSFLTVFKA
jgi:hypothetical protein